MHDHALVQSAAAILAQRQRQQAAGPRLPESCRPADIDTALAIQERTTEALGARIGGWKCGTPGAGKLVVAPIHADRIRHSSPCPVPARATMVRIEPELAFILARDLPARTAPYAREEIDEAVGAVHLALELIGSRYEKPEGVPFAEHLADRLLNDGLYIGPRIDAGAAREAASMPIAVSAAGSEQRFDAAHPDGNPLLPLYWLANFLRERGRGLRAGEAVITGSYVPSFEVPAEQDVSVSFGSLGVLNVRFGG